MSPVPTLSFGQFVGTRHGSLENQGFSFVDMISRSDQPVPIHTHLDAHFVFILAGEYLTDALADDARCGPRTLIFNPPGTTHRDCFPSGPGRFFTMSITPERFTDFRSAGGGVDHAIGLREGDIASLAARAYREFRAADTMAALILEGLTLELLGHTSRRQERRGRFPCPPWLRRARELIQDECTTIHGLGEIASRVGVHPYHLARSYRRHFGQTPGEHLRACRIQRAGELLRLTRQPLGDVALGCGYSDQSQFTRSFKRATGVTPSTFRRDQSEVGFGLIAGKRQDNRRGRG